jgi:hypothetical protein
MKFWIFVLCLLQVEVFGKCVSYWNGECLFDQSNEVEIPYQKPLPALNGNTTFPTEPQTNASTPPYTDDLSKLISTKNEFAKLKKINDKLLSEEFEKFGPIGKR